MTQHQRQRRLDVDEFLEWAGHQPGGRFELADGVVVAMAPERMAHVRAKGDAFVALRSAIAGAGLGCEASIDGVGVRVDESTLYIPDVFVRCGPRTPDDAMDVSDPVIVVEVVSPTTSGIDSGAKLFDYFRLPSLHHYLIVQSNERAVIHYTRDGAGDVTGRTVRSGTLMLDPPGLTVEVEALFVSL